MMHMIRRRYYRILLFFSRVFLGVLWWEMILPRLGFRRLSHSTRNRRLAVTAQRFRKLAVQMGGVMIKVGQFLSSRLDVLPREITDELAGLQDEVAPAPFEPIRKLIEAEFGMPLNQKFSEFQPCSQWLLRQLARFTLPACAKHKQMARNVLLWS